VTIEETGHFLDDIETLYPNAFQKVSKRGRLLSLWTDAMKDYDFEAVRSALQTYFKQDNVGRIPTAGMLIELIEEKEERYADHEILHSGPMDRSKYTTKDGVFFGLEEIVIPRKTNK